MNRCPILGVRGSPLALAMAAKVASALEVANRWPAGDVKIVTITTSGDRIQDRPLADMGGKALWTKELDRALLEGIAKVPTGPYVAPSKRARSSAG